MPYWWFLLALTPETTVALPAGSFRLGDEDMPDARPVKRVQLSAFRIDRAEVSIAKFNEFFSGTAWSEDRFWSPEGRLWRNAHPTGAGPTARASGRATDHPVVAVTFYEAEAYCAFAGGMLPTEAQWERAACGEEPRPPRPADDSGVAWWFEEGKHGNLAGVSTHPTTAPSPPHAFGLLDIYGNVWEWTRDTYRADGYARLGDTDPVSTVASPWRTVRGGSYMNLPSYAGCAHREPVRPEEPRITVGIRCVYPG